MDNIPHLLSTYGYVGIFASLMAGIIGLPFPDETILMFAGYLIFKGYLQPLPTFASAFLGACCGITVSFLLGRSAGAYLLSRYGSRLHLDPERLDRVHIWFQRRGKWTLFFGYFIMGVRHLTALVAGSSRLQLRIFALFAYSGVLFWTLTFLGVGYFLGEQLPSVSRQLRQYWLIGSGLMVLAVAVFFIFQHFRHRRLAS
ncbi:MAG: DedA family protein [Syntrophales bacterium]|nr:DedA family protein [Syntrophales bacterium]MDD5640671.1 DedA family protein [Syntrophales bacterium]